VETEKGLQALISHGDPMKSNIILKILITGVALLAILACNATFTSNFPTPTHLVPTETTTVTPSPVPATPQVSLTSVSIHEENQAPNYQIKANIPTLQGSTDAQIVNFNTNMTNLVNGEITTFKKNVSELTADAASSGSTFDVTYALTLQRGDIWSFKFDFSGYYAGGAHPGLYSITVNYDLGEGRQLVLSDLFLPNSNYLETISNDCVTELKKQPYSDSFFFDGAKPIPENYRNWNLTADGLMITFDEYQVAPYAAGPQTVVVLYSELQAIINPEGPLAKITQ
jgi:hypothetical protein